MKTNTTGDLFESEIVPKEYLIPKWNTIHVFGFGVTQVVGLKLNGQVANEELDLLESFLGYLAGLQPQATSISREDFHALTIINGKFISFAPKSATNSAQRFLWSDMDAAQVNNFVDEVMAKMTAIEPADLLILNRAVPVATA